jgi:hypothetical protein
VDNIKMDVREIERDDTDCRIGTSGKLEKVGKFLSSCTSSSFSRGAQIHRIS